MQLGVLGCGCRHGVGPTVHPNQPAWQGLECAGDGTPDMAGAEEGDEWQPRTKGCLDVGKMPASIGSQALKSQPNIAAAALLESRAERQAQLAGGTILAQQLAGCLDGSPFQLAAADRASDGVTADEHRGSGRAWSRAEHLNKSDENRRLGTVNNADMAIYSLPLPGTHLAVHDRRMLLKVVHVIRL
jgi:hypothetical protein